MTIWYILCSFVVFCVHFGTFCPILVSRAKEIWQPCYRDPNFRDPPHFFPVADARLPAQKVEPLVRRVFRAALGNDPGTRDWTRILSGQADKGQRVDVSLKTKQNASRIFADFPRTAKKQTGTFQSVRPFFSQNGSAFAVRVNQEPVLQILRSSVFLLLV
jgi:hypothetical protein